MHDGDELYSKPGLYITGDVLDSQGNRIPGRESGVHDNAKAFYLEVGLVQGLKGAPIMEVVVKQDSKMGVCDGSDKCRVFG